MTIEQFGKEVKTLCHSQLSQEAERAKARDHTFSPVPLSTSLPRCWMLLISICQIKKNCPEVGGSEKTGWRWDRRMPAVCIWQQLLSQHEYWRKMRKSVRDGWADRVHKYSQVESYLSNIDANQTWRNKKQTYDCWVSSRNAFPLLIWLPLPHCNSWFTIQ